MASTVLFSYKQVLFFILLLGSLFLLLSYNGLRLSTSASTSSPPTLLPVIPRFPSSSSSSSMAPSIHRTTPKVFPKLWRWSNSSSSSSSSSFPIKNSWVVLVLSSTFSSSSSSSSSFLSIFEENYKHLFSEGWKMIIVTDSLLPSSISSKLNSIALKHHLLKDPNSTLTKKDISIITLDLSSGYEVTLNSSSTSSSSSKKLNILDFESMKLLQRYSKSSSKQKFLLGFFFAISQGAESILHLGFQTEKRGGEGEGDEEEEEEGVVFLSPPKFLPSQLGSVEIPCKMYFPGKDLVNPYSTLFPSSGTKGSKNYPQPFDDEIPDSTSVLETLPSYPPLLENENKDPNSVLPPSTSSWNLHPEFDLAPQRLRIPVQQILPSSSSYESEVESHLRQIKRTEYILNSRRENLNRTTILWRPYPTNLAVPENSFAFLNPQLVTLFHYEAFWGLPITHHSLGEETTNIWSLWIQRALWEIDSRISFSNSTAYLRTFDKEGHTLKEEQEQFLRVATKENFHLMKAEWPERDDNEGFFDNLLRFTTLLHKEKEDLFSSQDVELLGAWLQDLLLIGYKPPAIRTLESRKIVGEREANLRERFLYSDLSGWGLNNQRDNLIQGLGFAWLCNWTLHLPRPYSFISTGGQPFYRWDSNGEIAGTHIELEGPPPLTDFDNFWDSEFLSRKLRGIVRIVPEFPEHLEFDQNSPSLGIANTWDQLEPYYMHNLGVQKRLWGIFAETHKLIYFQNPQTLLFPRGGMLEHDSSVPFRRLFEGGIKTAPKHNEKVDRALAILRKASKPFLKQGRYLALHWNRGSIIYSTWDTLGEIPGQHMALWVNTFFKKVLKIPLGTPIFVFGASIESGKSVPKELIEGYKAITVKELFPDVRQTTSEGFLLQEIAILNFELALNSFGYFATNFWSTFDDEVCFMRHRVWMVTNQTLDICQGVPRNWLFGPNTLDPVLGKPLWKAFRDLKDGPPKIFDPEVYPKMTSWDNEKWIIPEETKRLTDLNFIGIPKEEEEEETKRRKKKVKSK